jgi:hypothetical protein
VRVPLEIQSAEIVQGHDGGFRIDVALSGVAPQRLHDFEIDQVRRVQAFSRVGDTLGD